MSGPLTSIVCQPIGIVRSRFVDAAGMPIQTAGAPQEIGRVEVFDEYAKGLRDIEGFEYLMLITHFHRCEHERLEVVPFLDNESHGVFATRAPARPNRLGLSIVRVERVLGQVICFSGNDMMDGTPVLDIKPYVPRFDVRHTDRTGWFERQIDKLGTTLSDDRMK